MPRLRSPSKALQQPLGAVGKRAIARKREAKRTNIALPWSVVFARQGQKTSDPLRCGPSQPERLSYGSSDIAVFAYASRQIRMRP